MKTKQKTKATAPQLLPSLTALFQQMPMITDNDNEEEIPLTRRSVFSFSFAKIPRENYKRTWIGNDYEIKVGRYKGGRISKVTSESWLIWALNRFEVELEYELRRALIDQFNSLYK